jgi:hydrogenase expression/formation protein HypD
MEVCGGHTHIIAKYALEQLLPNNIEFIHGPGCPVCILPKERIDHAFLLSQMPDTIIITLGDMMRVPGSKGSLSDANAEGADVRFVYSPLDAIEIAQGNPNSICIFYAIGFETTTPMTAALIKHTIEKKIKNLFFHINHVTVVEPMEVVIQDPDTQINAFIAPGHVSVVTGAKNYDTIIKNYKIPVVVSGFEPVDIMASVWMILKQISENRAESEIEYKRSVSYDGNRSAQKIIKKYFEKAEFFNWRGIGTIPKSSLKLKSKYSDLDAEKKFKLPNIKIDDHKLCICGEILKGKAKPFECRMFAKACTPEKPLGACMVSNEGTCAAYFKYRLSDFANE